MRRRSKSSEPKSNGSKKMVWRSKRWINSLKGYRSISTRPGQRREPNGLMKEEKCKLI